MDEILINNPETILMTEFGRWLWSQSWTKIPKGRLSHGFPI